MTHELKTYNSMVAFMDTLTYGTPEAEEAELLAYIYGMDNHFAIWGTHPLGYDPEDDGPTQADFDDALEDPTDMRADYYRILQD